MAAIVAFRSAKATFATSAFVSPALARLFDLRLLGAFSLIVAMKATRHFLVSSIQVSCFGQEAPGCSMLPSAVLVEYPPVESPK
ncbi:hypothetical protein [Stieleria sp. JC731]|uniref:hypothetical protein n=1 Tax=Stieleria sp. JC731 TaxID=2894195 RepID=UPI001E4F6323|nr:hypothetical protein [Stieleria sp. JC731]